MEKGEWEKHVTRRASAAGVGKAPDSRCLFLLSLSVCAGAVLGNSVTVLVVTPASPQPDVFLVDLSSSEMCCASINPPGLLASFLTGDGPPLLRTARLSSSSLDLMQSASVTCWPPCPTVSPWPCVTPCSVQADELEGVFPAGSWLWAWGTDWFHNHHRLLKPVEGLWPSPVDHFCDAMSLLDIP